MGAHRHQRGVWMISESAVPVGIYVFFSDALCLELGSAEIAIV
jgi:hypothetical protein